MQLLLSLGGLGRSCASASQHDSSCRIYQGCFAMPGLLQIRWDPPWTSARARYSIAPAALQQRPERSAAQAVHQRRQTEEEVPKFPPGIDVLNGVPVFHQVASAKQWTHVVAALGVVKGRTSILALEALSCLPVSKLNRDTMFRADQMLRVCVSKGPSMDARMISRIMRALGKVAVLYPELRTFMDPSDAKSGMICRIFDRVAKLETHEVSPEAIVGVLIGLSKLYRARPCVPRLMTCRVY
jgi:hypothetical protein